MCSCKTSYTQGGRVVTSGVALIRRATFFIVSNLQSFFDVAFRSSLGRFLVCQKSVCCEKSHLWFYHKWSKLEFLCINGRMRIHTRTPRNTTLHHPSTHSDTNTDQKHHKPLHFRTHLDQSRKCLYLLSRISGCAMLNLCWSTKGRVVAALGCRWTWRLWRAPTNTTAEVPRTLHLQVEGGHPYA